jgi:hypothetical protein
MINIPRSDLFKTHYLEKNTFLFRQILQHDKIKKYVKI